MTGEELAAALEKLGVDVAGWKQVSIKPGELGAENEKFWRQGWQLGQWLLAPGAGLKKVAPNFGKAIEQGSAYLHRLDCRESFFVGSLEELAGVLLDPPALVFPATDGGNTA